MVRRYDVDQEKIHTLAVAVATWLQVSTEKQPGQSLMTANVIDTSTDLIFFYRFIRQMRVCCSNYELCVANDTVVAT